MVLTVGKSDNTFLIPLTKNPVHLLSRATGSLGEIALRQCCFQIGRLFFSATIKHYYHE